MESRGYGKSATQQELLPKLALISALVGILAGISLLFLQIQIGYLLVGFGLVVIFLALFLMSRSITITRYKKSSWRKKDTLVASTSVFIICALVLIQVIDPSTLAYYPYPKLILPDFNPLVGILLTLLVIPAVIRND